MVHVIYRRASHAAASLPLCFARMTSDQKYEESFIITNFLMEIFHQCHFIDGSCFSLDDIQSMCMRKMKYRRWTKVFVMLWHRHLSRCIYKQIRNQISGNIKKFCLLQKSVFMHTQLGFPWTQPGLGNVILHGGVRRHVHDVSMKILTSWRHFHLSFRQTFRCQRIGEELYRNFLDWKM